MTGYVIVEPTGATKTSSSYTTITTDLGTAATPITTTAVTAKSGVMGTVSVIYPTPVTTCGNAGIKYAMYSNSWAGSQGPSGYPAFTPQAYKTVKPTATGTATYMGESNPSGTPVTIYGRTKVTADTLVMDHTFYFFAGHGTGYYSFNIPYADDVMFTWIGSKALSGWTRANADLMNYWYSGIQNASPSTIAYYLTQGSYTPIRVQWANGGGDGNLQFNIYNPDGSYSLSSTLWANSGYMSPDIVTQPCNSSLGAAFPAWGSET